MSEERTRRSWPEVPLFVEPVAHLALEIGVGLVQHQALPVGTRAHLPTSSIMARSTKVRSAPPVPMA